MNMDDIYSMLGETVSKRRKALGMTQADLAKLVGLSRASIANIEVGRQKMLVHQVYALASALQLDSAGQLLPIMGRHEHAATGLRLHMGVQDANVVTVSGDSVTARQRAEIESLVNNARPSKAAGKVRKA